MFEHSIICCDKCYHRFNSSRNVEKNVCTEVEQAILLWWGQSLIGYSRINSIFLISIRDKVMIHEQETPISFRTKLKAFLVTLIIIKKILPRNDSTSQYHQFVILEERLFFQSRMHTRCRRSTTPDATGNLLHPSVQKLRSSIPVCAISGCIGSS